MSATIVMPVRNEGARLRRSLAAVLSQDYPSRLLEVIVADGMSEDDTRAIVKEMMASHPRLRMIDNPSRIVPTGLNCAIREARGDVIVRVDGHTVVARDYVSECLAALRRTAADNVGGPMRADGEGWFGKAVAAATSSPFGVGGARFHYSESEEWVDTVYLGAWRRETLHRIGLFDEEMVRDQDDELNYRLLDRGGRILLSPKIRSSYTVRGTPRSLWRQYFQYGFWKVRVMQKHPRQIRLRQLAPPAFVAALVLSAAAAWMCPGAVLLWCTVPLAYAAANLAASLAGARGAGWRTMPQLPLAYAIIHLAYGLGSLAGLARFMAKWRARHDGRTIPAANEDASA
jgi:glycosyltransferase involved in cell wall biosynthesis